jgi:hypothetical protein
MTWEAPSIDIYRRPPLTAAIVTNLVTRPRACSDGLGVGDDRTHDGLLMAIMRIADEEPEVPGS